ncbi:hypothetical protein DWU98_15520 [Dyella monticola]|uniref:Uncharacterized protein n=1 Tax=Dyella monticola TaxID=1927958 RepID=A0A370WUQ3_9GAMM|nr:hypothetical protein [Dyella monticola]RDS79852.1 hypothetical protein DWU98_15520 [Dyella monticola]
MKPYTLGAFLLSLAISGSILAKESVDNTYLNPQLIAGQTYSNVFSILRWIKAPGFDEHVGRNGGSADYAVLSSSPSEWRFSSTWRYDGLQGGQDQEALRDNGRTYCSIKLGAVDTCKPYLEASGLLYNPAIWGVPPSRIVDGMTWNVKLNQAWELGGKDGVETVTVIRVDNQRGSVTLMREGDATGFYAESDPSTIQLSHDGNMETFDVMPGRSHWKGYTTFVKGVVFSDELLVTRKDVLRAKNGKTFEATERRIMLLNAAPYPTL